MMKSYKCASLHAAVSTGQQVGMSSPVHLRLYLVSSKSARGGGYLVYLSDRDVPFFRVSLSPIFSRTGYQKKANFLEQVVKTCQKRKFC